MLVIFYVLVCIILTICGLCLATVIMLSNAVADFYRPGMEAGNTRGPMAPIMRPARYDTFLLAQGGKG